MPTPLFQAKAELFRSLAHPVRVRALEILQDGPCAVRDMLPQIGVEPASLSQQLGILRRAGLVTSTREDATVVYSLSTPDVADLMLAARRILTSLLTEQQELLTEMRMTEPTL